MNDPRQLKYSREHEWIAVAGEVGTIGITDFAQQELGDIVFVEESVKAVSEIYSPVSGTIEATNEELSSKPELINQDPYGKGWMVRVRMSEPAQVETLMDESSYQAYLKQGTDKR